MCNFLSVREDVMKGYDGIKATAFFCPTLHKISGIQKTWEIA